jgi:hypothetical protein
MDGHRMVVVDVSRLRFLSATGVGVLARAARAYADAGGGLTLVRPTSTITRLLAVTGLQGLLSVERDGRCGEQVALGPRGRPGEQAGRAADRAVDLAAGLGVGAADRGAGSEETALIRICAVLAGVTFPAMRWQLLAQADYYGADHRSRAELADLPEGRYADIATVQRALRQVRRLGGGSPGPMSS